MERVLTTAQMRDADSFTVNKLGISEEELIIRAGKSLADVIARKFFGGRVLVVIGKGNNGKDGQVAADILSSKHGFTVRTMNVANGIFKIFDNKFDIIVDCIFGTGLNREVDGKYRQAIERINESGAFVVSCDIPSGLNGDNGMVMGVAVKANLTVAIQELKLGYFLNDGPDYTGEVVAKDIGISIWGEDYIKRLNDCDAAKLFSERKRNVNKGNFGKATVFGGSKDYPGSVLLSQNALCALKMGVGYANLAIPECLFNLLAGINPECTVTCFDDKNGKIVFDESALSKIIKNDSIAVGMGMTCSEDVFKTVNYLLKNYKGTLIIDADGINVLAKYGKECLKEKQCAVIITPHIGEFARLVGAEKEEIKSRSVEYAKSFAKEYGVIVVLKSAVTVITDGAEVYINTTGCSAMAKAGSGDLLSGIMAGLAARTDDVLRAVCVSCYLAGRAGEIAQKNANEYTVTASDVIKALPETVNSF